MKMKCLYCKKDYIAKRKNSKYCSDTCGANWRYHNKPKIYKFKCIECNGDSTSRKSKSKFCSSKCSNKHHSKKEVTKICPECGKNWKTLYYSRNKTVFCSYSCSTKNRWKSYDLKERSEIANKISISHKKGYKSGKIQKRYGQKSPNWKGGLTKLSQRIRTSKKYVSWRQDVFIRDNFCCVVCGDHGFLNADHIKPFSFIIKENKISTLQEADKCKELWDLENGRTLCVKCHKETSSYGAKIFTL